MSNENTQVKAIKEKLIGLKDKFLAADNQMKTRFILIAVALMIVLYFSFTVITSGLVFLIKLAVLAGTGWLLYQYGTPYIKPSLDYLKDKKTDTSVSEE